MVKSEIKPKTNTSKMNYEKNFSNEFDTDSTDIHKSKKDKINRLKRCRENFKIKCRICLKRIKLPSWLSRPLLWIYTHSSAVFTYGLFLLAIYACIISINANIAIPPQCRLISVVKRPDTSTNSSENDVQVSGSKYEKALECRHGEALSILIFYGFGFLSGEIMELLHLPGLLGMLLGGLFLRNIGGLLIPEQIYHSGQLPSGSVPYGYNFSLSNYTTYNEEEYPFNITDPRTQFAALLLVNPVLSGILRQLALTTILTRAGLGLDPEALKQVCGSVFRLAFIPCLAEASSLMLFSHLLIGWPWSWGAILGFVCSAVSPAVIVPNMMRLEVTGWGVAEGIPTLVVAASSLDDVVAITGFGVALGVALSVEKSLVRTLFWGPLEAIIGASFGAAVGLLLLFFPPPKLEHSHFIRGILLVCFAITGLIGSVAIHLPGGGALSCLTLAFIVATGWRNGFPWRLTQSVSASTKTFQNTTQNSHHREKTQTDKQNVLSSGDSIFPIEDSQENHATMRSRHESFGEKYKYSDKDVDYESMVKNQKDLNNPNILESLVEFHPYYCSILRQQYGQYSSAEHSSHSSFRNRLTPDSDRKRGDLPSLAVAVAATGIDKKLEGSSTKQPQQHGFQQQIQQTSTSAFQKPRASRRFSLPEPTAHYELESFTVAQQLNRGRSPSTTNALRHLNRSRRRILVPDQYSSFYSNQPVEKVEEVEENDECTSNETERPDYESDDNNNDNPNQRGQPIDDIVIPATPVERGLACLNSMRRTMAVTWWFVQPILFSLIGSEVDILHMPGGSTGRGIGAFLLSLIVRLGATLVAVLPSKLNMRERLFIAFAWLPKATVQAAVGPVALDTARRLNSNAEIIGWGEQVVTLAAIAILITAPLGAILMPLTAPYLLHQDVQSSQVMIESTHNKRSPKSKSAQLNNANNKKLQKSDQKSPKISTSSSKPTQSNIVLNTKL
ncbi:Sodium/hydrogen exchanger 9B2 [Schistosoma japonicum]|uniref:Sodium/hydrogen exchanger 9B2 n=2 Tax=Schistosoma japonicum TaxID=6182 RepID=A0A4Z2CRX9_SCHJA|nr:Sodium/hydrogen exchanger 9B2 [Schistosoma japonicum]